MAWIQFPFLRTCTRIFAYNNFYQGVRANHCYRVGVVGSGNRGASGLQGLRCGRHKIVRRRVECERESVGALDVVGYSVRNHHGRGGRAFPAVHNTGPRLDATARPGVAQRVDFGSNNHSARLDLFCRNERNVLDRVASPTRRQHGVAPLGGRA